jgi:hypothetical protein
MHRPEYVAGVAQRLANLDHIRQWPEAVRARLYQSHRELLANAARPVLDLADPEARELLTALVTGRARPTETYNSVVSVAALPLLPDAVAAVRAMKSLLALRGDVLFDEPIGRPGTFGLVLGTIEASARSVRGFHLNRDIVGALRAGGLEVISVRRSTVATPLLPLRRFARGAARHYEDFRGRR